MLYNVSKDLTLSPHNDSSHQASTKHIDNDISTSANNCGYGFANSSQEYDYKHASLKTSESKNRVINTPHNININLREQHRRSNSHINAIPEASFNSLQINQSDFNSHAKHNP